MKTTQMSSFVSTMTKWGAVLALTGAIVALLYITSFEYAYGQTIECDGGGVCNPLDERFSSIPGFIAGILQAMVMISLPILTLFIVYSGFLFVFARGNTSQLETAKRNFLYVIIGSILILGAWVIATLIGGTVKQLIEPSASSEMVKRG